MTLPLSYSHERTESDNSLAYFPPPGGYPTPIAQPFMCHTARSLFPQPIHILSTTQMPTNRRWQQSQFKSSVRAPSSPVANARLAANISYAVAVAMTVLLLPVMCKDARLLVLLPVILASWYAASESQRWYRTSLHFDAW